eukprot:scaffold7011_cov112-Isochrysis_galbana.AAC.20
MAPRGCCVRTRHTRVRQTQPEQPHLTTDRQLMRGQRASGDRRMPWSALAIAIAHLFLIEIVVVCVVLRAG